MGQTCVEVQYFGHIDWRQVLPPRQFSDGRSGRRGRKNNASTENQLGCHGENIVYHDGGTVWEGPTCDSMPVNCHPPGIKCKSGGIRWNRESHIS